MLRCRSTSEIQTRDAPLLDCKVGGTMLQVPINLPQRIMEKRKSAQCPDQRVGFNTFAILKSRACFSSTQAHSRWYE